MGLFDFVKNIGEKIFGGDDDPATKIREHLESRSLGITALKVEFQETDGKVFLHGQAPSPDVKEKAVLLAGNVKGVSEVFAEKLTAPEQKAKVEYYVIESGDTLSKIAKKYLGDAMAYPKIFEANREVIKDANLIYPGQKIRIPLG
jgi:nucleoid-associated protein YgaU